MTRAEGVEEKLWATSKKVPKPYVLLNFERRRKRLRYQYVPSAKQKARLLTLPLLFPLKKPNSYN